MPHQPEHPTIPKASRLTHIALMVGTLALAGLIFNPLCSPILWAIVLVNALASPASKASRPLGAETPQKKPDV